jgi:hypothetical protein
VSYAVYDTQNGPFSFDSDKETNSTTSMHNYPQVHAYPMPHPNDSKTDERISSASANVEASSFGVRIQSSTVNPIHEVKESDEDDGFGFG